MMSSQDRETNSKIKAAIFKNSLEKFPEQKDTAKNIPSFKIDQNSTLESDISRIKCQLTKALSLLNKIDPNTASNEDILSVLSPILNAEMTIRAQIYPNFIYEKEPEQDKFLSQIPITISQPNHSVLRVSIPPLIKEKIKGSYNNFLNVKFAIANFFETSPLPQIPQDKLILIYKRFTTNISTNNTTDNDNWEMKRTTNAISESIMRADNASNFSIFYITVEATKNYVEATVIKQQDLPFFIEYMQQ